MSAARNGRTPAVNRPKTERPFARFAENTEKGAQFVTARRLLKGLVTEETHEAFGHHRAAHDVIRRHRGTHVRLVPFVPPVTER